MNTNIHCLKRLSGICVAAVAVMLAACQADDTAAPALPATGGVTFQLSVETAVAGATRTPAVAAENAIATLDVLAFGPDGSFAGHFAAGDLYTIDGGKNWLYRLPLTAAEAHGLRFVFFANLREEVGRAVAEGRVTVKDELYKEVKFANKDWATAAEPYPLWGETRLGYDSQSAVQSLNRVSLLRPVAAIDVVLNGNATEAMGLPGFKLACIEVRGVPAEGYAAPAPGHFDWAVSAGGAQAADGYAVSKPTVVGGAQTMAFRTSGTEPTDALRGRVIVPETAADGGMALLIGGYYGHGGQLSWYKVAISSRDAATGLLRPADLLRGKRYLLNITEVGREGFATADEASRQPAENIEATLELRPDAAGLNHIVYNGAAFIAADKAWMHVAAGKPARLQVLSTAAGGWQLAGLPEWLEASAAGGAQGVAASVDFALKDGYAAADCEPATVTLRAAGLQLQVEVYAGGDGTVEYETPYVAEALQAADFGLAEGGFVAGGGMAFWQGRYIFVANNAGADATGGQGPSVIVYDMEAKKTVATIAEWAHGGQALSFRGPGGAADRIDDIAVDTRRGRLYVARRQSCVEVFDISDPSAPAYVTRIGKLGTAGAYTRNRLSGSGAVLAAEGYLLVRDDMSLDTYLYGDITAAAFEEITCVTRDNRTMTHSGHQPAQWATDPTDGSVYLTYYSGDFKGIYRIDPSGADRWVEQGKVWQQQDLRSRAFALGYRPTGLLITADKVYVTRHDGTLDVFGRSLLASAPAVGATRAAAPSPEGSVSLLTTAGRPGRLLKVYQDPGSGQGLWSMDVENNAIVRLNMFRTSVEVTP